MVKFKESTHQYFNENGVEYLSATRFLHLFQLPFDAEGNAERIAKFENTTKEVILKRWRDNSREACTLGTHIHALMETYIKKGIKYDKIAPSFYDSFDKIVGLERNYYNDVTFLSEHILYNDEYRIAGTADLIIDYGDEFTVGDFKTNNEINMFSKYNERFLEPISNLSQCEYNLYSLQLSLYAYFYSLLTGKRCRRVFLMSKNRKEWEWKEIPCNNMEYEIRAMLEYYKNNKKVVLNRAKLK